MQKFNQDYDDETSNQGETGLARYTTVYAQGRKKGSKKCSFLFFICVCGVCMCICIFACASAHVWLHMHMNVCTCGGPRQLSEIILDHSSTLFIESKSLN